MLRRLASAAICLVMLLLGFIGSKVIRDVPYFQVDTNIDVVAITALLITIAISAVFYRSFEKVKYSDQLKKTPQLNDWTMRSKP